MSLKPLSQELVHGAPGKEEFQEPKVIPKGIIRKSRRDGDDLVVSEAAEGRDKPRFPAGSWNTPVPRANVGKDELM